MNTRAAFAVTKPSIFNLIVSHQVSEFNVWKTYLDLVSIIYNIGVCSGKGGNGDHCLINFVPLLAFIHVMNIYFKSENFFFNAALSW